MTRPLHVLPAVDGPAHPSRASALALPPAVAASLRSACLALVTSPEDLASVSVVAHLPAGTVLTRAIEFTERLASEYGCRAHLSVHDDSLDVRFDRPAPDTRER